MLTDAAGHQDSRAVSEELPLTDTVVAGIEPEARMGAIQVLGTVCR